MIMRVIFSMLLMLHILQGLAQKHDNIWLFGSLGGPPTGDSTGVTLLDYSNGLGPKIIEKEPYTVNFFGTNAVMCDSSGNLLFYTNGEHIYNRNHGIMENGKNIAVGDGYGYRLPQGAIALPFPEHPKQYVLLTVEDHPQYTYGWKLFYHIIDMSANNGLGMVTDKRHLLVSDSLTWGQITAVKHANGRDWWFLIPEQFHNRYYIGLISPSGIILHNQQVGEMILSGGGAALFSPIGDHYIWVNHKNFITPPTINIFDFDRCTGLLSNQQSHTLYDPSHFAIGASVSPDSKYLYAFDNLVAYQYDLTAPDIFSTETIVAEWDGAKYKGIWPTDFYLGQLAPDGRIYINTSNSSTSMHRINFPNRAYLSCKFVQNEIRTPTESQYEMPNFPNFRLGPLDGSSCDTLGLDNLPLCRWRYEWEDTLKPHQITFTDLSSYEPDTWHWDFGDGTVSADTSPVHTYAKDGLYQVCLIVSNVNSADTLCRWIQVGTSATHEVRVQGQRFKAVPNPADGVLTISASSHLEQEVIFDLYAVTGEKVRSIVLFKGDFSKPLNTATLPAGVYFYQIRSTGLVLQTGKMIIAH